MAQRLDVRLTDSLSNLPVAGAVVGVLSAGNDLVAERLSAADGHAAIALPAAGMFRVRIRRVGFSPYLSEAVTVDTGAA